MINECGRLPVALKAVAAMVAEGVKWSQLLNDFHDGFQLESFAVHVPTWSRAHAATHSYISAPMHFYASAPAD